MLSMIAAAALSACVATPVAMAGNEIVKCVDTSGQVTLTDQPCETGAATVRLTNETTATAPPSAPSTATERHVLPAAQLRHEVWKRPQVAHAAPLSRDVATLKAARRMLMLQETRPRLAGLN
jgi:hypothetical protein